MPWRNTEPTMERARFIALHEEGLYSMSELCDRCGISRKTGYKWLARYEAEGLAGLEERSRAPHSCPHRTAAKTEAALVSARETHPTWGPKKLLPYLARTQPELPLPAPSTAGEVLERHGLIEARKRRRPRTHPGSASLKAAAPNAVWMADFKGEFPTRNGSLCYPLTVTDAHSRFLLACRALPSTQHAGAQPVFTRLFATYGLPQAIRTDNGSPFSSPAIAGLSRLSVWWTKLGIQHQLITPGRPQENGRHERMHRTLKAETTRPPDWDLRGQQSRFDAFCAEFNQERPHEALGQRTPGSLYLPAARPLPARLPEPEYDGHLYVRRVSPRGSLSFSNRPLFISEVLAGECVGLEEIEEGVWSVYFYGLLLGRFHEREWKLRG
jgi:putative transposase